MTESASTVSAVLCTHDEARWDALRRAVSSLQAQTRPIEELIVVVDQNPALLERVRTELAGVVAIANANPPGLSAARNTAVAMARGSLIAFLDDDAAAAPDWVERLAEHCRDPDVLGAGGRVVPRWLGQRPRWFPEEFFWVIGCSYRGMPLQAARVRNLYGGCFCIRRDIVAELGGFRIELGRVGSNRMGCEETELCIRASQMHPGRGFRYDPEAVIEHDVPPARTRWSYFRSRCFAEGVSKARLTSLVGSKAGLASERAYSLQTLPAGMLRDVGLAVRRAEPVRLMQAAAIAAGLAITAVGYASERAHRVSQKYPKSAGLLG
jgi:glycosyltransferase involved in cell wall biosynthesis